MELYLHKICYIYLPHTINTKRLHYQMDNIYKLCLAIFLVLPFFVSAQVKKNDLKLVEYNNIKPGASNTELYSELLSDKRIAIVGNHTSLIGSTHLVDSLISSNFRIVRIFSPEHGFRGTEDAGKQIKNSKDIKTGIPVISLYGKHKKPTEKDLRAVDIVLFDIQDVGARFYTYISTLTYVMEACAENNIPLIVLDRPNPNGFYIDGPVLEKGFESFVGLHPVPIVYGMTIGEYAQMLNGEKWLNSEPCDLTVIPCKGYERNMIVKLAVSPSPNLPNWYSVYLYPSLCLFEGTIMSVGRGTELPFQIYGHPGFESGNFAFMPESTYAAKEPKFKNDVCYGQNLISYALNYKENPRELNLDWLIASFQYFEHSDDFFNAYFDKLAGNSCLRRGISNNYKEGQLRQKWVNNIEAFKKIRKLYLIYPDLE